MNVGALGPQGELGVLPMDHDHVSHMISLRAPPPSFNVDVTTAAPAAGIDMDVPPGWRLHKKPAFEDPRTAVHSNDFYVFNSRQEANTPIERILKPESGDNIQAVPRVIYPSGVNQSTLDSTRLQAKAPPDWEERARVPPDLAKEQKVRLMYRYGGARRIEERRQEITRDGIAKKKELLQHAVTNNFLPRRRTGGTTAPPLNGPSSRPSGSRLW